MLVELSLFVEFVELLKTSQVVGVVGHKETHKFDSAAATHTLKPSAGQKCFRSLPAFLPSHQA